VIARAAGVPLLAIEELNPHFLRGYTPGGSSRTVRLPAGTGERFSEAYPLIPPSERLAFVEHIVAAGETFSHIARAHGVPLDELMATNSAIDPRRLRIGMRLQVPSGRTR
jgi:membrane-bound lytic murein transglycosylase D